MRGLIATFQCRIFQRPLAPRLAPMTGMIPLVFMKAMATPPTELLRWCRQPNQYLRRRGRSRCSGNNDEARSVLIKFDNLWFRQILYFKAYSLWLLISPTGSRYRDRAKIEIFRRPAGSSTLCLRTFQMDKVYDWGNHAFEKADDGKLKGKIFSHLNDVHPLRGSTQFILLPWDKARHKKAQALSRLSDFEKAKKWAPRASRTRARTFLK